ncbi:CHASE2 domain-containing sensor protein [Paenibacillus sp. 4624]|uniref:Uncharacterized protein n=1 Tax=Paenibacillus amylolyticus TaxID=1451 RepID=A0A5M9WNA0_PAEAM|nr:hypothetical protein [Paenibacillus amylolyticus]KAA8783041.1 hypothetical protein EC604_04180 [Paenibacillus amylolyticus]
MHSVHDSSSPKVNNERIGHTIERLEPGFSRLLLSSVLVLLAARGRAPASERAVLALSWYIFVIGAAMGAWMLVNSCLLLSLIVALLFLVLVIPYVVYMQRLKNG